MSLLVALVVVIGTWSLFKSTVHLMFDGVSDGVDVKAITAYLKSHSDIASFHDLHITAISTSENSFSVHIVKHEDWIIDGNLLDEITSTIQHDFNLSHVTIQIESKSYSNACKSIHCIDN